jgi:hypothetical protein
MDIAIALQVGSEDWGGKLALIHSYWGTGGREGSEKKRSTVVQDSRYFIESPLPHTCTCSSVNFRAGREKGKNSMCKGKQIHVLASQEPRPLERYTHENSQARLRLCNAT